MSQTITIPAWWLLVFPVFMALVFAQNYFSMQACRAMRDLFNLYWREQYGEDFASLSDKPHEDQSRAGSPTP